MIDDKTKERVLELHEQGLNKKEIAGSCEISYSSVGRILNESEDYEPELDYPKDSELGVVLTNQFLDEGYDLESEVKRLTYELIVLSGDFKMTSFDFLKDQIAIVKRYVKLEGDAIKKYDFFWDISQNMALITESFDVSKLCELIDNFIDREIYFENLDSKIEETKDKYKKNKAKTKKSKDELVKIQKELAEARSYKNQLARAFIFNAEGEKLKKVIKEKDIAMNNLKKGFSEIGIKADSEYGEIINDQKLTVEIQAKMIKDQENKIKIYREKFDEFLTSYPEAKNYWNNYINELNGVKTEQ